MTVPQRETRWGLAKTNLGGWVMPKAGPAMKGERRKCLKLFGALQITNIGDPHHILL
jgi:hypothetical protein